MCQWCYHWNKINATFNLWWFVKNHLSGCFRFIPQNFGRLVRTPQSELPILSQGRVLGLAHLHQKRATIVKFSQHLTLFLSKLVQIKRQRKLLSYHSQFKTCTIEVAEYFPLLLNKVTDMDILRTDQGTGAFPKP